MTNLPEDAASKLEEIVNHLSQDVVLGKGDWKTLEYFQQQLQQEPVRFRLAQIAHLVRCREWNKLQDSVTDLAENNTIPVPDKILDLCSMTVDVTDLLRIPRSDAEKIQDFRELVNESYEESDRARGALQELIDAYVRGQEEVILNDKPFSHDYISRTLTKWLSAAVQQLGWVPTPRAMKKRKLQEGDEQQVQQQVQELRQARNDLREVVQDPLDEARAVARQAGHFYEKKSTARRLNFDDHDEEIDEPAQGTHQLSEVPELLARPQPPSPAEHPVKSSPKQRVRWTAEQKNAFKAALKDYGVGSWAQIRDSGEYRKYWMGKDNVQLKDLFRNMKKSGELD